MKKLLVVVSAMLVSVLWASLAMAAEAAGGAGGHHGGIRL